MNDTDHYARMIDPEAFDTSHVWHAAYREGRKTLARAKAAAIVADVEARGVAQASWQPIETAPKDGTHIILYAGEQEYQGKPVEPRLTYGYWLVLDHGKYLGDCGGECRCPEYDDAPPPYWYSEDGGFTPENPPTHWQQLPNAPSVSSTNRAARKQFSQCEQCWQPATCKKYGCSASAVSPADRGGAV